MPKSPAGAFDLVRVNQALAPPDQWFTMEVIARENHLVIKVNGQVTADIEDRNHFPAPGHLALVQNTLSTIEFRKIEIKELKGDVPAPPRRRRW